MSRIAKRNWKATQAENAHLNNSEKLLKLIAAKIEERGRAGQNGERDWGHAGDAENLQEKLLDIVAGWELTIDECEDRGRERILNSL